MTSGSLNSSLNLITILGCYSFLIEQFFVQKMSLLVIPLVFKFVVYLIIFCMESVETASNVKIQRPFLHILQMPCFELALPLKASE